jgi:hypothetical protein
MAGNITPMMFTNAMKEALGVPTLRLITESLSKKGCAIMENSLQSSFESERLSSALHSVYLISHVSVDNKENNMNVINNIKKRKNNDRQVGVGDASKSKRRHLNSELVLLSYEERVL